MEALSLILPSFTSVAVVMFFVLGDGAQALSRLVLMEHPLGLFPDIEVVFPHGEQDGHVLLSDNMALTEPGVFGDAGDDLGQIVAEHMPPRAWFR